MSGQQWLRGAVYGTSRHVVCQLFAAAALLTASAAPAAESSGRPNVIIILADDLGYGDLACFGHPKFKTPNLDQMAAEGARLTNFNTPAPFCAPTRASLLTGRYPLRCGMSQNPAPDFGGQFTNLALPASEVTLADLFRQAGYATGMIGKWHLGHAWKESYPSHRGFDEYLGILYSNDMRPVQLIDGDKVIEYPVVQATLTERYTQRALNFIERSRDKPFFLYFAHAMPHKPLAANEKYYKKSGAGLYGDVIEELDASVGQLLDKLKELKLDDRTFVIFTSDNGPWFGGYTAGLRGMKGTSWEGGYRVPFIARWPGRIPPGHVSGEPAMMMDVFATALKVAAIAPPTDRVIDGADIMSLLVSGTKSPHSVMLGQQGPNLATIRDGRWKLHVLPANEKRQIKKGGEPWIDPRAPDGVTLLAPHEQYGPDAYPGVQTGDPPRAMALFDLASDPAEQHDVSGENPEVVKRLKAAYDKLANELGAPAEQGRERK